MLVLSALKIKRVPSTTTPACAYQQVQAAIHNAIHLIISIPPYCHVSVKVAVAFAAPLVTLPAVDK